jgi:hypothetical protein
MTVHVAGYGLAPDIDALLDAAARGIGLESPLSRVAVPDAGLPKKVGKEAKRVASLFAHTPRALIESWRWARHLTHVSEPGDTVLVTDNRGLGGMFALEQALVPPDEQRWVVAVAGSGTMLHWLGVAGTRDGLSEEHTAQVDWERVLYRYATETVALAPATRDALQAEGFVARIVGGTAAQGTSAGHVGGLGGPIRVWLPEPVSRESATPEIVRALAEVDEAGMLSEVVLSVDDRSDEVWKGVTWDHVAPIVDGFTARVVRANATKSQVGAVVLGSLHRVMRDPVRADSVVFARAGSAALVGTPGAVPWTTADDLAAKLLALAGPGLDLRTPSVRPDPATALEADVPKVVRDDSRAHRVSVGVPIYRNARHVDECVTSILRQDQPVHEILLVDDGSRSREVDATVAAWVDKHPQRVRALRQPNRGVCVARNRALTEMTGDSFVFVDADDVLDPRFVSMCAQALRSDTRLTAVATWTEFFGDYSAIEAKPPFDLRVGLRENPIISTCVLVDMSVRDAGLRFTPDLAFLFCEDWALWSEIVAQGGEFGLVPRALARHRVHQASGGYRRSPLAQSVGRARATEPLRSSGADRQ